MSITHSSAPKRLVIHEKTNVREDRIMRRISMGNRFNTAAGIACQFSTEQGLSAYSVSTFKRHLTESPLCSGQTSHQQKNQKARPTFADEHVVWREENWSKAFIWVRRETLCSPSNWGKTEPKLCKDVSERWRKCHGLADVFCSRSWATYIATWLHVYPLQSPNCRRDRKKIGPRSYQSSVRDYSDVLWPQMCWSHSKQLISDCCNIQKL